eukprot:g29161.t2
MPRADRRNIFLSKTQDAVLGDFSIAKVLGEDLAATQIGTPGYLAPEIWLGQPYGPKSDVFSLGCSIFEAANRMGPGEGQPCERQSGKEKTRCHKS